MDATHMPALRQDTAADEFFIHGRYWVTSIIHIHMQWHARMRLLRCPAACMAQTPHGNGQVSMAAGAEVEQSDRRVHAWQRGREWGSAHRGGLVLFERSGCHVPLPQPSFKLCMRRRGPLANRQSLQDACSVHLFYSA